MQIKAIFGGGKNVFTSAFNPNGTACNNDTGSNSVADCDAKALWSDDNSTVAVDAGWTDMAFRLLKGDKCIVLKRDSDPVNGFEDVPCNSAETQSICEFTCPSGLEANPKLMDCVAIQKSYTGPYPVWVQAKCSDENYFICEKRNL